MLAGDAAGAAATGPPLAVARAVGADWAQEVVVCPNRSNEQTTSNRDISVGIRND
ncbi:hypothetical protein GCM10028821_04720 [Hymenobacter jeollabukensis]